jgi:hypothetical protein
MDKAHRLRLAIVNLGITGGIHGLYCAVDNSDQAKCSPVTHQEKIMPSVAHPINMLRPGGRAFAVAALLDATILSDLSHRRGPIT